MAVTTLTLGLVFLLSSGKTASAEEREYCETETFEAACDPDEVVVIEEALYGRMQLGRCVRTDYGFVGCKVDVLAIMNNFCSGKQTCSVDVPNMMLDETRPCPPEFKLYLWAKYSCVKADVTSSIVEATPASTTNPAGPIEYCQNEIFEANCKQPDEVIVMQRAKYGRMRLGRCIDRNFGHVGCHVDVLSFADMRCSGKRTCAVPLPNRYLDDTKPCPEDLKMYLEAEYTCIGVTRPQLARCEDEGPIEVKGTSGTLSSAITRETGCGSTTTPWVIRADPGQQISLHLIDFGLFGGKETGGSSGQMICQVYAVIKEGLNGREITVCGGLSSQSKERHIYTSQGHYVEVAIVEGGDTDAAEFLLKFEVTGCSDLQPPANSWMRRQGTEVVAGCVSSGTMWKLTCKNGTWVGDTPACVDTTAGTAGVGTTSSEGVEEDGSRVPTLAIGVIFLSLVVVGLVAIVVVLLRKIKRLERSRPIQATKITNVETKKEPVLLMATMEDERPQV